jgi:hypothetical protein
MDKATSGEAPWDGGLNPLAAGKDCSSQRMILPHSPFLRQVFEHVTLLIITSPNHLVLDNTLWN